MTFRPQTTSSEYQERIACEFRARTKSFVAWLHDNGVNMGIPGTAWEVLRYTAWDDDTPGAKRPTTRVIYRKGDGRITFTGGSYADFNRFLAGQKMGDQSRQIALDYKRAHSGKSPPTKKASWAKRTRQLLHERDGDDCWFCCAPLTYMNADHLRGPETIEHMIAQSLAEEMGLTKAMLNHMDNLVLAHARCNREAGHKTVAEKEAIRAMHVNGLKSDVPWWSGPGYVSDASPPSYPTRGLVPSPPARARPVTGNLDAGVPNHTDHTKRGFTPK